MNDRIKEAYKRNLIDLVRHHRKGCNSEHCGVSLYLLLRMAKDAGVVFSSEEVEEFL